jgi:hypothetical protein
LSITETPIELALSLKDPASSPAINDAKQAKLQVGTEDFSPWGLNLTPTKKINNFGSSQIPTSQLSAKLVKMKNLFLESKL